MIRYVLYKGFSVNPCEHVNKCKLIEYFKWGILRGPWVCDWCTQVYTDTYLLYLLYVAIVYGAAAYRVDPLAKNPDLLANGE